MNHRTTMTVKGQVTVPKDVRDALGLKPGEQVEFDWNAAGEAIIRKAVVDPERERTAIRQRIEAVSDRFAHLRSGRATDDIMRDIRGDDPYPP